jgi:hypothetical protein
MEAYFFFRDDNVITLLMHFVKIASLVRAKLDDVRSIDRLEQAIRMINTKYANNKRATDLVQLTE